MATKEIMAFSEADIKNITLTVSEFDTLKYLSAHAGIEMDEEAQREFVAQRNARINEIVSISELKAKAKKLVEYLDNVLKHAFNVGSDEDLPKNVSWSKQTFTDKFENPLEAVRKLIELEGTPVENFAQWVTPKQAAEAAGITIDRLNADVGDMIVRTPKERTLKIK